ncbi:hypothetical protein B9J07_28285 [Sinorhizobium sp. LM21]|uniref:hypothetical protein n=1 Tax=Sinorhizobium sp. LM21 TaxID=1449788 RepID=UPI0005D8BAB9|nr:hypothetical protein [Sinorhizobium sp. LM21]AJW30261.1 hypothetical protein pLM21S1_p143 [Sinorhizobium sp. LM21]OWZ90487.1 hypothetical protein B9J07_28285 [Sinorhizobium sp. LM21]
MTGIVAEDRFVEAYNDKEAYPNLTDVAVALGLSYQTVRNRSSVLRARLRAGEDVPVLINRAIQAAEKDPDAPVAHAHARADLLRADIDDLLTRSRYPVTNPDAVVIDPYVTTKYDRRAGKKQNVEGTPRTWLTDTLTAEPVEDPRGRVFIFTGAQNDAEVDLPFWENLQAYASFRDADIIVGPGTYETQWWSENNSAVRAYAPEIEAYLCFGQMKIGESFVFCGEMNMLPTANRPISDLTTYTQGRWGVFPHSKIQLKSVPSLDPTRQAHQVMTTGLVTKPKIIPRKAGIKSIATHQLAAVLVEFDHEGDLFCRHLIADKDGSFQDLEFLIRDGEVTIDEEIDGLVMADLHSDKEDRKNFDATFRAPNSITRTLKVRKAFAHDIFDNYRRNHHNVHDNAHSYEVAYRGRESVLEEIRGIIDVVIQILKTTNLVVVESNHDIALERYVREGRYRGDGINVRLGLQLEDAYLAWRERVADAIDRGEPVESFSLLEYAFHLIARRECLHFGDEQLEWVHDGYSYVYNGVECGNHGFRGANGARGTVAGFAALGRKMNIGDKHSPEIMDDVYVSGVMNLRQGYNKGPSGWAVTHTVQYKNGKRTLVTLQNGKWRAFI